MYAFIAAPLALKLHSACLQSGSIMARYTIAELADMDLIYEAADCKLRAGQPLYEQHYPKTCVADSLLHQRLSKTVSLIEGTQ